MAKLWRRTGKLKAEEYKSLNRAQLLLRLFRITGDGAETRQVIERRYTKKYSNIVAWFRAPLLRKIKKLENEVARLEMLLDGKAIRAGSDDELLKDRLLSAIEGEFLGCSFTATGKPIKDEIEFWLEKDDEFDFLTPAEYDCLVSLTDIKGCNYKYAKQYNEGDLNGAKILDQLRTGARDHIKRSDKE